MAMFILRIASNKWKRHSPIFDMESFFWTLVFVPLYRNWLRGSLSKKDETAFRDLCPKSFARPFSMDANAKLSLMLDIAKERVRKDSCLASYLPLLQPLAEIVGEYYDKALAEGSDGVYGVFQFSEEDMVVDKYVEAVEKFLTVTTS